MVQERSVGHRNACSPSNVPSKSTIDSSDDDANRTRRLSVTECARIAAPMPPLQALNISSNIGARELKYPVDSGEVFQATRTHPEARDLHNDLFTCRLCRPSIDAIEAVHLTHTLAEFHHGDTVSERGQARGLRRSGCHSPTPKKKRRASSSTLAALRTKRRPATNGRATIKLDYDSDSEDESDDESEDDMEELKGAETELQQFRIDEVYPRYYNTAFPLLSQLGCKDTAKSWIRAGHPKKQTSFPYNGGKERGARSLSLYGYRGHFTKPDYWPPDQDWEKQTGTACRHREPDHVKKPERLRLLVHLLRSQNRGFKSGDCDFSMKKLRQSTNNIHLECGEHWTTEVIERLEEIYRVRDKELEFERGDCDGGTLISVLMPKRRCKVRKPPKPAVKAAQAASPPSLQLKKEPEEPSSTARNAPIANMDEQIEDDAMDLSEDSTLSILVDTSSSTEEVAPCASCPEPIVWETRTIQDGPLFSNSLSPTDGQSWTSQSADCGRDHTVFMHPSHFGSIATPGVDQRSLPLRDQYRFGPSSMRDFPSQIVHRQYGHGPSVSERVAPQMRPNGSSPCSAAAWPVAPEMENNHYPAFAASSTGQVGAFSLDADHTSWQTNHLWDAQMSPSVYTAVPDPIVFDLPYAISSFASGYGNPTLSSGLPSETRNNGNY